ncbi:MAG: hypothetical protein ACR2JB_27135 [Bryobacteraceae bacterium]
MRRHLYLSFGFILLSLFVTASQQQKPEGKAIVRRTVKVHVNYKGSGRVDTQHKIFIFLFNSPGFVRSFWGSFRGELPPDVWAHDIGNAMVAIKAAVSKDEIVTLPVITSSPAVYAAVSYDPSGGYDGHSGPPPSGSSLRMYSRMEESVGPAGSFKGRAPAPISVEAGTIQIEISFDDSEKMP